MPPKQQKQIPATAEVVDLDSSDEEGGGPPAAAGVSRINKTGNSKPSNGAKLQTKPPTTTEAASATNSGDALVVNYQPLDGRSFWRAGAYEIGPTKSTLIQGLFLFFVVCFRFFFFSCNFVNSFSCFGLWGVM